MILDEAFSPVDLDSGQTIPDHGSCTTVMVAQRILLVRDGLLMENGTHQRLMDNRDLYATMVDREQHLAGTAGLPAPLALWLDTCNDGC